jgi:hypothetical protein
MSNSRPIFAPHYTIQKFWAFTLCLLLTVTPACARTSKRDYFPLVDGARWEYTGHLSSSNGQFDIPAVVHIDGETIIHGKHYFKYVIESDFSSMRKAPKRREEVRYYRRVEDGIYFLPARDTDGGERLEMPLPVPIGVSWLSGTSEVRAEHAGALKVGEREYSDCLKITYTGSGGTNRVNYYLAPGVGMIKSVYLDVVGPGSSLELDLVSYKLQ